MKKSLGGSWVVTIPLVGVAIAYIMLLFLPKMNAIGAVQEQLRTKQEFIRQNEKMRFARRAAADELSETLAYVDCWKHRCAAPGELANWFGKISQLAKASGASINKLEPQTAIELDTMQKVPVVLDVTGSSIAIQKLIKGLEALPVMIWVEDMKLGAVHESGETVKCDINLAIFIDNSEKSN